MLAVLGSLAILAAIVYPDAPKLLLVLLAMQLASVTLGWFLLSRAKADIARLEGTFHKEQEVSLHQTQALVAIHSTLRFRQLLPEMGGWTISPDLAAFLVDQVRTRKPKVILETGSGVSTILIGYVLQDLGSGRLISLDHDEGFAAQTRENVAQHGLSDVVEVIYAPLKPVTISGETWLWYDLTRLPESARPIDFLLVDGPPYSIQRLARYPAVPLLAERLAAGVCILLDDAARNEERQIAERWTAELPGSSLRLEPHQKGTAVIERTVR